MMTVQKDNPKILHSHAITLLNNFNLIEVIIVNFPTVLPCTYVEYKDDDRV